MNKLSENQKGFSVFEALIVIIIVVAIGAVGWLVYHRTHAKNPRSNTSKLSNSMPPGTYTSENYTLGVIDDDGTLGVANPYKLQVYFNDSWNPNPTCPLKQPGFAGKITATNMTDDGVTLTLTQNRKPYTPKPEGAYINCGQGDTAMDPDTSLYTLNTAWLEGGSSSKTLTINGRQYVLHVDKTNYTLMISNGLVHTGVLYFPEGIGALGSDSDDCMSVDQLKVYAQANGMELAETRYPGSAQILSAGTTFKPGDSSSQQIFVIADDNFVKLSKQASQQQSCHVHASDSVVSGAAPTSNGSITVGAKTGD